MIGEFWAIDTYSNGTGTVIPSANLYTTLYTEGYKGAWAWQYANADNPGPADYPTTASKRTGERSWKRPSKTSTTPTNRPCFANEG